MAHHPPLSSAGILPQIRQRPQTLDLFFPFECKLLNLAKTCGTHKVMKNITLCGLARCSR
jgi:hypothetical protein